jgi:hypothetical protein
LWSINLSEGGEPCITKLILSLLASFLLFAAPAGATPEEVVSYDLSLAGYRIGMSYDEAVSIRPLFYTQNTATDSDVLETFNASTDPVYVDDIELDVRITFKNDAIYKVIARFSPSELEDVAQRFQRVLGRAEDRSKILKNFHGKEMRQKVYSWDFPNANMFLIATSSEMRYATIALTAKKVGEKASADN